MTQSALREFIWTYIEMDPMVEWGILRDEISEVAIAGLPMNANFVNSLSKNVFKKAHAIKSAKKLLPKGIEKARTFSKIQSLNTLDKLKGLR